MYDHPIFEAFRKMVQKLITHLPTQENLRNFFMSNFGIEIALLFVVSKIYVVTDSTPVDANLWSSVDISCIHGFKEDRAGTPYKELTAIVKLNITTGLYLKEVTVFLALAGVAQ